MVDFVLISPSLNYQFLQDLHHFTCIPSAYLLYNMLSKCLWNGYVKYPIVLFSGKLLIFFLENQESYCFGLNRILYCDHFYIMFFENVGSLLDPNHNCPEVYPRE